MLMAEAARTVPVDMPLEQSSTHEGHKHTELGLIPSDWEIRPLLSAARIASGQVDPREEPYRSMILVAPDHIESGTGRLLTQLTAAEQRAISGKYFVHSGDVIYSKIRPNLQKLTRVDFDCLCSADMYPLTPGRGISGGYLAAILLSEHFTNFAVSVSVRSGMPKINREELSQYSCAFPLNEHEQQAVADALADADRLIEGLESLVFKKRQIKQGAMQELLSGQQRLPGFGGAWVATTLAELAAIRSGGTPSTSRPEFWDGGIAWCTPTDITALSGRKYLEGTARTISQTGLANSSAELIPPMSVIMTSRATIGECAINPEPVTTNQGFKNFVPHANTDVEFLFYLLSVQTERFIALCGGSTFLEIGKAQLTNFQVQVPASKDEQAAISTVLSEMDAELGAIERRLSKVRRIKQGMMQELLTGRVRLV